MSDPTDKPDAPADGERPKDTEPPPPSQVMPTEVSPEAVTDRDLTPLPPEFADVETTVDLTGDLFRDLVPMRDDVWAAAGVTEAPPAGDVTRRHLKGLLEALVFVSDKPIKIGDLAKSAAAPAKEVRELLLELKEEFGDRGVQLDEVAGGWLFRTNPQYAPFVRDLTKQKPVKLSRAQVETLAILAYRQPITRPEIDDIRGVDSGATLKLLLERDLIKILGKKDEPGRPLLYGTTVQFLEFFGLKSLKDMPTLREFTELNEDSRRVVERELGDVLDARQPERPADPGAAEDLGVAEPPNGEAPADGVAPLEGAALSEEDAGHNAADTLPPGPPPPEDAAGAESAVHEDQLEEETEDQEEDDEPTDPPTAGPEEHGEEGAPSGLEDDEDGLEAEIPGEEHPENEAPEEADGDDDDDAS